MLPIIAYSTYIVRTDGDVTVLQQRVALASTQVDTLTTSSLIAPRITAERLAIASALSSYQPLTSSNIDGLFVADLAGLARFANVTLMQVGQSGAATPFPATVTAPAMGPGGVKTPVDPRTVVSTDVKGSRLSRTVTIAGGLGPTLRFIDGLGRLSVPVVVTHLTFAQHDKLSTTIGLDILYIDRAQLLAAKMPVTAPAPTRRNGLPLSLSPRGGRPS
jgi:hypothetical protein